MRNYGAQPNFPKLETFVCQCGKKTKTRTALFDHIDKMKFQLNGQRHGFSCFIKHGTAYTEHLHNYAE